MKKIMTALATVAIAAVANAATFQWAAINAPDPSGTGLASGGGFWCFLSDSSKDQSKGTISVADAIALIESGNYSDLVSHRYKAATMSNGSASPSAFDGGWGAGDSLTAFAILFDVSTSEVNSGNASKYIVTAEETINFANATNPRTINFDLSSATWQTISGAEPVPEPTSGLLMLLGMAGLALRRKRA